LRSAQCAAIDREGTRGTHTHTHVIDRRNGQSVLALEIVT
jgi:hypothetical protein